MSFFQDILCKLGFHDWGHKVYHEEKDTFMKHSVKKCRNCGIEKVESEKEDWDKSK